jgi:FAD-dependent urate hydroxylase
MTRALIIGGGVCGPVTAMALQRAGVASVVYETRAYTAADVGSYLTVASNGLAALRAIGAEEPVMAAGFPTNVTVLSSGSGKRLGRVAIGSSRGLASHTLKRAHLHRALHRAAADRGIPFEFDKRLIAAEATASGVVARFDDGTSASGDLLIGCDGVHSVTRRLVDADAPAPRYVGLLNFGGYTPGLAAAEPGTWHMIFGRHAFFGYASDLGGGTAWFANVPRAPSTAAERQQTSAEEWKRQLVTLFAGDRGPAVDLISAGVLQLSGDNTHDLPSVGRWHHGPMIIIGDAAHAPSPSSGQGASMAIEDGIVLAKCLRDHGDSRTAFAAFERIRRPRVERIVAQGARSSSTKALGPLGRTVRDAVMPLLFRYVITDKSLAWMYDHEMDWTSRIVH